MSEALKPCPFCGQKLMPQQGEILRWRDHKSGTNCYMNSRPIFAHEAEAWNRRADLAGLPDDIAQLVAQYATEATENPSVPLPIGILLHRIRLWHEQQKGGGE
jgi:hypothetical protein